MITEKRLDQPVLMNASGKCYSALRKMLVCGQIPVGSRLAEVEWSQRLGAQRAALREAMALLAHDGLLTRRTTGGFFVPTLEEIRYEELIDARIVLELGAIDISFAPGAARKDLAPLHKICDTMEDLHHSGLTMGFCESDFLFHQKLLELSENEILVKMFSHSAQHIYFLAPVPDDVRVQKEIGVIQEHRQILADLHDGNIQAASDLLRRHIARTKDLLRSAIGGDPHD
ncbi:GntR family transcriptional regulator [Blastopirellula sp. J2-11]|uniref:GntR family transcriptional regulator n=1 Tax=Blastopirellula sp. J2-11 TaxID=2943192 RepID=UPI0021C842DD|nr:GntR family transcriptional regulator [Blastopirellula sp. J2-11]UUO04759.1 GntR family transcriptional regulator [Blastopirellula sp. J2-11]